MSTNRLPMSDDLYDYLLSISLREHPALKHLRQVTVNLPGARMQIAPEQGQFMQLLVQLMGARRIVEVGTYTGYSSLAMALMLPADGLVLTCDIDKEATAVAQEFWQQAGVAHKIDLRLGAAIDTLQQCLDDGLAGSFDLAFIDADKANYSNYYDMCLSLLRRGGLVVVDNVLWDGKVADRQVQDAQTNAIRALNEKMKNDTRVSLSVIPVADGLALARKL